MNFTGLETAIDTKGEHRPARLGQISLLKVVPRAGGRDPES